MHRFLRHLTAVQIGSPGLNSPEPGAGFLKARDGVFRFSGVATSSASNDLTFEIVIAASGNRGFKFW